MGESEGEKKHVGRPPKKDTSFVKLVIYEGDTGVEEWIASAKEAVQLKSLTGEEAVGYITYHIRSGAKVEIAREMMGGIIKLEKVWEILRRRDGTRGTNRERLRKLVERKQLVGESIIKYADALEELRMGIVGVGEEMGIEVSI